MEILDKINILGIEYTISYCDNPSEVDIHKRSSYWGQIDYWTRSIRIYANGRTKEDIFQTILHEVIHGIVEQMHLKDIDEKTVDCLATGLADTMIRNGIVVIEAE